MTDLLGHALHDEIAVSRWAFALPPDERDRLLLATASALAAEDLRGRPRARALLDALLPALARDADQHTRTELAHRLSAAAWAPEALLLDLAFDAELDLQRVVARAPGLSDAALQRLAAEGAPETLQALARRPSLPAGVLDLLVDASRRRPALRDPLARRTDLTPEAASRLLAHLGPDLAPPLLARFGARPAPMPAEPDDADARLIDKLQTAGRLTPAFAVGALRRGRPGVFGQAVARLGDLPPAAVDWALRDDGPGPLALACAAASVDRAAFPAVLAEARALRGLPRERTPLTPEIRAAFERSPEDAARALRTGAERQACRWASSSPPAPGP